MMNILITTDNNYLPHAYTMLVSLIENNPQEDIHLFYAHYDLDEGAIEEFNQFFSKYNLYVQFIHVDAEEISGLHTSRYTTHSTYLKLKAVELLPAEIQKILYLDPDIMIRKSIAELFNTDLKGCCVGAVDNMDLLVDRNQTLHIPCLYSYFNAGVLLIDVDEFRNTNISKRALEYARKMGDELIFYEQDVLNALLYDKRYVLHPRWNVNLSYFVIYQYHDAICNREIKEAVEDPAIIHFTGESKPWHYLCDHPYKKQYWYYVKQTPFRRVFPSDFTISKMVAKYKNKGEALFRRFISCFRKYIVQTANRTIRAVLRKNFLNRDMDSH